MADESPHMYGPKSLNKFEFEIENFLISQERHKERRPPRYRSCLRYYEFDLILIQRFYILSFINKILFKRKKSGIVPRC